MMQKRLQIATLASLLAISSATKSSELDNLIAASSAIVDQMDKGIMLAGAAQGYAYTGAGISDGSLAGTAYISSEQVQAYNAALSGMQSYQPYGSAVDYLEEQAAAELELMDAALDVFTEVVVDMISVQNVAEIAETAATPDDEAEVQQFVADNIESLTIDQDDADTYNQSLDDIETHANNAGAFLGVAASPEAVAFLEGEAADRNLRVEESSLAYSSGSQAVTLTWQTNTRMLEQTSVFLNGTDQFGLDMYFSGSDVLLAGKESELYITGPTHLGYQCFVYGIECDESTESDGS